MTVVQPRVSAAGSLRVSALFAAIAEALYERRVVVIRVNDNGPGISESIREKVFQPFFSTKEEGTGLGLAIVHGIIEQHNGSLDIISEPGQGACFVIRLPVNSGD